jgi:DNA-binding IclR family transcriptional regulator
MYHVHERSKQAILRCLHRQSTPISAEQIAEMTSYSVRQTCRILLALRREDLLSSWRPCRSHSLAYRVNEPAAIERGLLP